MAGLGRGSTVFAANGYDQLTSETSTASTWFAVKAVNNATATVTIINAQGDSSTALVIANGDIIYVTATSIQVTSGIVHAYRSQA